MSEQPEIIETSERLVEVLQETRAELHRVNQDLIVAKNNELMLWRILGQQLLTQVPDDG